MGIELFTKICIALLLLVCFKGLAQEAPPETTSNTEVAKRSSMVKKTDSKRIRFILKPNTKKTLYGNPCVLEITRSNGFEYMVTLKGQPGYDSELQRAFHNFGVNIALLFRNGPFWKFGLSRRIKICRQKSGDYVGP